MGRILTRVALLCLVSLACLLAASVRAQGTSLSERRFTMPKHGQLVMHVPQDWNAQVRLARKKKQRPPTVIFTPSAGEPFKFLVTAIWPKRADEPLRSVEDDRAFVAQAAERAKGRAVDETLPIVEFKGGSGPGFYFSSTDRIAQEDEFKFLTEGVVRVGLLSVSFTILTNEGQEQVVKQALAALQDASVDDGDD